MSIAFLEEIDELIAQATIEATEEDIKNSFESSPEFLLSLKKINAVINQAVTENRKTRLNALRSAFISSKENSANFRKISATRSIDKMLSEIAAVIKNKNDRVPEGMILAFRNQGVAASDEDIRDMWHKLVDLGLIDIDERPK
jgi:hypothetical protein